MKWWKWWSWDDDNDDDVVTFVYDNDLYDDNDDDITFVYKNDLYDDSDDDIPLVYDNDHTGVRQKAWRGRGVNVETRGNLATGFVK